MDPIPALGQTSFHKGTERPVPALLKALGQVVLHTEMERPVPALLKALGQVILILFIKSAGTAHSP